MPYAGRKVKRHQTVMLPQLLPAECGPGCDALWEEWRETGREGKREGELLISSTLCFSVGV